MRLLCALTAFLVLRVAPAQSQAAGKALILIRGVDNGPAEVRVDGKLYGSVDNQHLTVEVAAGARTIVIRKVGYAPFTRTVTLGPNNVYQLQVKLIQKEPTFVPGVIATGSTEQLIAFLEIISIGMPDAEIWIDGKKVGQSPGKVTLPITPTEVKVGGMAACLEVKQTGNAMIHVNYGSIDFKRDVVIRPLDDCYKAP